MTETPHHRRQHKPEPNHKDPTTRRPMDETPEPDRSVELFLTDKGAKITGSTIVDIVKIDQAIGWWPNNTSFQVWDRAVGFGGWKYADPTIALECLANLHGQTPVLESPPTYTTIVSDETDPQARYDLIPPDVLRLLAITYGIGYDKHGNRWQEEGYAFTDNLEAVQRHL